MYPVHGTMGVFTVPDQTTQNGKVGYPGFESEPESMEWVSQYADANMVKTDFFEARSTAYAKSTALIDDL